MKCSSIRSDRPDRLDVARGPPEHLLRLAAYRLDAVGELVDHDHRWLAHDDALVAGIDQRVGGAQVDRQIVREVAEQRREGHIVYPEADSR
jgi:hypothetical protein